MKKKQIIAVNTINLSLSQSINAAVNQYKIFNVRSKNWQEASLSQPINQWNIKHTLTIWQ